MPRRAEAPRHHPGGPTARRTGLVLKAAFPTRHGGLVVTALLGGVSGGGQVDPVAR